MLKGWTPSLRVWHSVRGRDEERMRTEIPKPQYWMFATADYLCRLFPRRFCYAVGMRIADAFYRSDIRARKAVRANLKRVSDFAGWNWSDRELQGKVQEVFRGFSKYLVDFFTFSKLTRMEVEELLDRAARERLELLRNLKRGALLVTGHIGNWELGGAVLAAQGYPITAVAQLHGVKKVDNLFLSYRRKRGMKVVPLGLMVVRHLIEVLRRGEFVALLADRDYTPRHQPVDFFGAPACLPRGPAWLASHYQVPVVAGFLLREKDDRFTFRLYPPLNESGDMSEEAIHFRIRDILQEAIMDAPTQWFMFENLWEGNPYGSGYFTA